MRLGIRAQLLLSIAALLSLALAPMFFAVASLARASFARVWQEDAEALGRSIAGHVSEARAHRSEEGVRSLLEAQVGRGVVAIGIYDPKGALVAQAGEGPVPKQVPPDRAEVRGVDVDDDKGIVVVVPGGAGPVATLMVPDPSVVRVG
ncbi:MAG TPA: two-component sensor histidine kinase, partial [Polyangiaceae bacterium]|nr:two-component sensor histidine kinase [Polyangiaceae bacterium]